MKLRPFSASSAERSASAAPLPPSSPNADALSAVPAAAEYTSPSVCRANCSLALRTPAKERGKARASVCPLITSLLGMALSSRASSGGSPPAGFSQSLVT